MSVQAWFRRVGLGSAQTTILLTRCSVIVPSLLKGLIIRSEGLSLELLLLQLLQELQLLLLLHLLLLLLRQGRIDQGEQIDIVGVGRQVERLTGFGNGVQIGRQELIDICGCE